jgi:hypothetical protein
LRVSRPMEVVVLNCWVTDTKETASRASSSGPSGSAMDAKVRQHRRRRAQGPAGVLPGEPSCGPRVSDRRSRPSRSEPHPDHIPGGTAMRTTRNVVSTKASCSLVQGAGR